ncbi:helix-turn-helix transcriptional regulator [Metabacillus herbersteinensis]|uniref:Helix-turn-helix transcriptional regulator n=1 Tax=Metabacillus herbersteinensis TaxID=283816 RepID=A0ABV6GCJ3_9BACI
MTKVGRVIEEEGYRKGWVAKKAKIAPGTLSKIISGESEPSLRVALKLSRVLNKTVEELWGHLIDEDIKKPSE